MSNNLELYSSTIFKSRTEEDVITLLKQTPEMYHRYATMNEKWRIRLLDFLMGKKSLPLTYDAFFKRIFHTDIHSERLSHLLSSILGRKVNVVRILPSEETLLDGGAMLIMDILVELEDGSLANVEVQKIPYLFPGERMSCYSSDLILRQYSHVKDEKGKHFKYDDLKKVYTIIFFEKTTDEFKENHLQGAYLHHGKTTFDTGLKINLLQEYYIISLDVFRNSKYPKPINEQTAWISLLATDDIAEIDRLICIYPWLKPIYKEIADYLHRPEEVLFMFSESLKMLDANTAQYMVEELQEEVQQKFDELMEVKKDLSYIQKELSAKDEELSAKDEELSKQKEEYEKEIAHLKELLNK